MGSQRITCIITNIQGHSTHPDCFMEVEQPSPFTGHMGGDLRPGFLCCWPHLTLPRALSLNLLVPSPPGDRYLALFSLQGSRSRLYNLRCGHKPVRPGLCGCGG